MTGKISIFEKGILRVHQCGVEFDINNIPKDSEARPPPVMIMLSGYPDTSYSWSRLAPHFEKTHLVLKMAMPAYEADTLDQNHRWGYQLTDIVTALTDLIEPYQKAGCPIHLVGHDWGAAVTIMYMSLSNKTPAADKVVLLDIGVMKELSWMNILIQRLYQLYFAFVFLVSRYLPNEKLALPLLMLFPFKLVGPCPYETEVPFEMKDVKIHMLYPYLQILNLFARVDELFQYKESIPQLFLYGGKKRVMFHSQSYLDALNKSQISKAVEFPESGHWLHWTHTDKVAHEMKMFLNR